LRRAVSTASEIGVILHGGDDDDNDDKNAGQRSHGAGMAAHMASRQS